MATEVGNQKSRSTVGTSSKWEVVQMLKTLGLGINQVCKGMEHGESAVRRWVSQLEAEQHGQSGAGKPFENAEVL